MEDSEWEKMAWNDNNGTPFGWHEFLIPYYELD
jgi:hypothetical protein